MNTNTAANTINTNSIKTTKKAQKVKKFEDYKNKKSQVKCYQKAKKGIESGANGKYFEALIKLFLDNINGKCVSSKSHIDTIKSGKTLEIKCGCGTIGKIENNCFIKENNSEFIIYCPIYAQELPSLESSYVFNFNVFCNEIINNNMQTIKKSGLVKIQNYKHRIASTKRMVDFCEKYGTPFYNFKF
jgi:hypothetical protein